MRQGPSGRRPRGRPNRKQHGGPPRANNYDSNGPEGRIRGNAHQVYEKYVALARDALSGGDRVSAETYYQHAEHYFRIINSSTDPAPAERRNPATHDGNGRSEGDAAAQPDLGSPAPQRALNGQGDGSGMADARGQTQGQPGGRPRNRSRPKPRTGHADQADAPKPDRASAAEPQEARSESMELADGGQARNEPAGSN